VRNFEEEGPDETRLSHAEELAARHLVDDRLCLLGQRVEQRRVVDARRRVRARDDGDVVRGEALDFLDARGRARSKERGRKFRVCDAKRGKR
jgi:hypothetical protein